MLCAYLEFRVIMMCAMAMSANSIVLCRNQNFNPAVFQENKPIFVVSDNTGFTVRDAFDSGIMQIIRNNHRGSTVPS